MSEKYGWWKVRFDCKLDGKEVRFEDLSECTQEHICKEIMNDCRQGVICEVNDED